MNKQIFDCLIFFNELDMLELRFRQHWDNVDYFVVCEATRTFQGLEKPLYFQLNTERFKDFSSKIVHIIVNDMPSGRDPWERENFQRNAIRRGLFKAEDHDIIIVSDSDELISNDAFSYLRANEGLFVFDMAMYQFYVNMLAVDRGWMKVFAFTKSLIEEFPDFNVPRVYGLDFYTRYEAQKHLLVRAGWHFTFLGGSERVREKLNAYSHTDAWQTRMMQDGGLERQILELRDVGGGGRLQYCDIDESFPEVVRDNLAHYVKIGFVKLAAERVKELERLVGYHELDKQHARDLEARLRYLEEEQTGIRSLSPRPYINLALGRPSTQSSTSSWSNSPIANVDASGANNGRLTGGLGFHTESEERPWWQVDLGALCAIRAIRIFNRQDQAARLRHFSIVASVDCENWILLAEKVDDTIFGQESFEPFVAHLTREVIARYVRVCLNETGFLHFDECMLFGIQLS